jgi:hypothetical protein
MSTVLFLSLAISAVPDAVMTTLKQPLAGSPNGVLDGSWYHTGKVEHGKHTEFGRGFERGVQMTLKGGDFTWCHTEQGTLFCPDPESDPKKFRFVIKGRVWVDATLVRPGELHLVRPHDPKTIYIYQTTRK